MIFFSKTRLMAGLFALAAPSLGGQTYAAQEPSQPENDAGATDENTAQAPADAAGAANEPAAEIEVDPVESAIAFTREVTDAATTAFSDDNPTYDEKLADFQLVLTDALALEVIGKFMMGETYRALSEEQRARYDAIFPEYITRQYADQFADIVGRPLEVSDAKPFGKRDVVVRTQFMREDASPVPVDWRVRRLKSGEQKMIDIIVNGVSIMLVKREEFSAFLAQNDVDDLLAQLEIEAAGDPA